MADGEIVGSVMSVHLFGLRRRRLDLVLTLLLVAVVVASRVAAFPASIWDQDEAYFAAAVTSFDVTTNHPHPPWFPLWIGMAKVVHVAGVPSARSLQLVSGFFGTWILFPLVALWSLFLQRRLAVVAALLFMMSPVSWMLAGRAFSGTAATALLVLGLALILPSDGASGWRSVAGSVALGMAVLVRPHMIVSAAAIVLLQVLRLRRRSLILWAPFLTVLMVGGIGVVVAAGGVGPLLDALAEHASYHFGALASTPTRLSRSGFVRGLGGPLVALPWLALAVVGVGRLLSLSVLRRRLAVLAAALLPLLTVVFLLSDSGHARYFVPLLALTSGFAVAGVMVVAGRMAPIVLGAALAWFLASVIPALQAYRSETSPPLRALSVAFREAADQHAVLLVDRTLVSFVDDLRNGERSEVPVIYDALVLGNKVSPPPPDFTIGVFDRVHLGLLADPVVSKTYSCSISLVRYLGDARFMDISTVVQPRLRGVAARRGPLIIVD